MILIPALLVSGSMIFLLQRERRNIGKQIKNNAFERVEGIAESLRIAVNGICGELSASLNDLPPPPNRLPILKQWRDSDPMIRNVFIWQPPGKLIYPEINETTSDNEKYFAARYRPFFSGERPWKTPLSSLPEELAQPVYSRRRSGDNQHEQQEQKNRAANDIYNMSQASRQQINTLYNMSKQTAQASFPDTIIPEGDWIRWFDNDRLHMLCWRRQAPTGQVWGLELEISALLSRLIASFPESPEYLTLILSNGNNRTLHQSGKELTVERRPDIRFPLGPELPHWELSGYLLPLSGRTLLFWPTAGILLVVIFLAAIICGGLLLTAQSQRNWREAQLKTTFVSNVSHELKTPLTTIRMYTEMLSLGRIQEKKKQQHYLNTVVTECGRLTRLVNNVLDFSRLEQNRRTYRIIAIDLPPFINTLINTHQPRIEGSGMIIRFTGKNSMVTVRADPDALEQVILNLIDNAVKYAPEGKVIEVTLSIAHPYAELCIMDRGPGIPAAHRKKIFEAFHRVDDSITTSIPGSGLGLSIARRLLTGMDGILDYIPRAGGGSIFKVLLPLNTAEAVKERDDA